MRTPAIPKGVVALRDRRHFQVHAEIRREYRPIPGEPFQIAVRIFPDPLKAVVVEGKNAPYGQRVLVLQCETHTDHVFGILGSLEFLLPYCHEYLIRNDGLMGVGIEIPCHEAIILDLDRTSADRFFEAAPDRCIFSSLSIASRFHLGLPVGRGGLALPNQQQFSPSCHQQDTAQISSTLLLPHRDSLPVHHQD